MDRKDNTITYKRLSSDSEFYNNVFKKSEKISAVVFYILSFQEDKEKDSLLKNVLEKKSFSLHETSLKSLSTQREQKTALYELRQCLIELSSTIEVSVAARIIPADMAETIVEQIDAVHRYLSNHYLQETGVSIESLHTMTVESELPAAQGVPKKTSASQPAKQRRQQRVSVPAGDISTDAYLVYSQLTDRAERIKTVLEAKPQASVKDVSEIITDVSEKTIQRELNSLIEKGQVVREGERRWSRYSVVKDK